MRILIYPITLLFLTSCSFESIIISNLDFLITNRLSKVLSLNYHDKAQLRYEVRTLLDNNKEQFKEVKTKLESLDVTKANVVNEMKFFDGFYLKVAQTATPLLAKKIASFDQNQYQKFKKVQVEKNQEIQEKNETRSLKDYVKRYEYFFGDLIPEQKQLVSESIPLIKSISQSRLKMREETQKKMEEIHTRPVKKERYSALKKLLNKASDRSQLTSDRMALANKVQKFIKTLSPKQVKSFNERKAQFIRMLNRYFQTRYL